MVDLDEYRAKSLQNWDSFSGNWADEHAFLHEATGGVARALGDGGKLIQTDFAPGMVEQEKRLAADAGLSNIEHRVMDAENMDLEDSSVDGVVVRYGYMLMADPAAALSDTKRVLRDGGNLSFAVWTAPDLNLWAFIL